MLFASPISNVVGNLGAPLRTHPADEDHSGGVLSSSNPLAVDLGVVVADEDEDEEEKQLLGSSYVFS